MKVDDNQSHGSGGNMSGLFRRADYAPDFTQPGLPGLSHFEVIGEHNNAPMAAGYVYYENTQLHWKVWYDELIILHEISEDGEFIIEVDGMHRTMSVGDIFYLSAGTTHTYHVRGLATTFYVVVPPDRLANMPDWAREKQAPPE